MALARLERHVQALEGDLAQADPEADLTSASPAMRRALDLAHQAAPGDARVLLRGESGTGKGVVARAIHAWSPRRDRPFVTVSCPALPAELLESELFGHVRGAFTGAGRDNPGRVAIAEGGGPSCSTRSATSPSPLQPKLLRFIQDREYERLGDPTTRRADVRILAATNQDLERAVAAGRFREDLLYRLNVLDLRDPPPPRTAGGPPPPGSPLPHLLRPRLRQAGAPTAAGGGAGDPRPPLAGQRPRAQKRRRARHHARRGIGGRPRAPQGPRHRLARGRIAGDRARRPAAGRGDEEEHIKRVSEGRPNRSRRRRRSWGSTRRPSGGRRKQYGM